MPSIPPPDTWRWLLALFGPPRVAMREGHAPGGAAFDHGLLDVLLQAHVAASGTVDYAGLAQDGRTLDAYLDRVAAAEFDALSRNDKLALLINLYNAATLRLVLDHMPLASIRDIPAGNRWKARRWSVGGRRMSLADIENRALRANFTEPRIHFAINCASNGCPPLRNRAFTGAGIDAELDRHTQRVHADPRWCRITAQRLHLTRVYRWYEGDFVQGAGSVRAWVEQYAAGAPRRIGWLPYDWSLNARQ